MIGAQLQKAIERALATEPALAGGKIFDRVPPNADFPRITIGEDQVLDDGNSCSEGWEVFADVHVWSRKPGKVEAKTIAAAVVDRMLAINTVEEFTVLSVAIESSNTLDDPDGKTAHVAMTFRVLLDPA